MEILIPGLILVALMAYASTRIKKRAAAAFASEFIDTDSYSMNKPEGFLHVIGDRDHEFRAYSKEFGENEDSRSRKATIELDILQDESFERVCESIKSSAARSETRSGAGTVCTIETEETANESAVRGFYKVINGDSAVYRLRFAVLAKHLDDYLRKIDETLDSFTVKSTQHL